MRIVKEGDILSTTAQMHQQDLERLKSLRYMDDDFMVRQEVAVWIAWKAILSIWNNPTIFCGRSNHSVGKHMGQHTKPDSLKSDRV